MTVPRKILSLASLAAGFLTVAISPGLASTSKSSLTGTILFWSTRDGNAEIYSMRPDGSAQTRLTWNEGEDSYPIFSPAGRQILFYSQHEGQSGHYVMQSDGSQLRRVSRANETKLMFLSENRVMFVLRCGGPMGYDELWARNLDGTDAKCLYSPELMGLSSPCASPDGKQIAFVGQTANGWSLQKINSDGSALQTLVPEKTPGMEAIGLPVWSKDSRVIYFVGSSTGENPPRRVWSVNADGKNLRCLTPNHEDATYPVTSYDNQKIAFFSETTQDISLGDNGGTLSQPLAISPGFDGCVEWSRDSTHLAFVSNRAETFQIFLQAIDSGQAQQLTWEGENFLFDWK